MQEKKDVMHAKTTNYKLITNLSQYEKIKESSYTLLIKNTFFKLLNAAMYRSHTT